MEPFSVLIWCKVDGDDYDLVHDVKSYDTAEHVKDITDRRAEIEANYSRIMEHTFHIKYDFKRDPYSDLVRLLEVTR